VKSRIASFPEATSIDWCYAEFALRWGKEVMEREHKPVTLATPEQLARVAQLNDTLKTTPEEIDKHLSYGEATQYADMSTDKIQFVISRLEAKLPK
jgi:predicted NodU family carbamoyl transferase